MKKIIFFLISVPLFSENLNYNDFSKMAFKKSPIFKIIQEDLEIEENNLKSVTYPSAIAISGSFSPGYNFVPGSNLESGFEPGSFSLGISPYYGVGGSLSYNFDGGGLGGSLTFSPLASKRESIAAKNSYTIAVLETEDKKEEFSKELKKSFISLYYARALFDIDKKILDHNYNLIEIKENLVAAGKLDLISLDEAYIELMDLESKLYASELEVLKQEEDLFLLSGVEMDQYTLISPEIDIDKLEIKDIDKDYSKETEFLRLKDKVRDYNLSLKETKRSFIPDLSITGGFQTENYSDYTGFINLSGSLQFDLNYKNRIKSSKIYLERAERELETYKYTKDKSYKFRDREIDIKKRRIDILKRSYLNSNKRLKITEYKYNNGEILEDRYNLSKLDNSKLKLELYRIIVEFNIDYGEGELF